MRQFLLLFLCFCCLELMKLFSGRGYPTYVLLLPDGTVQLDVPRPSQLDKDKMTELIGE